MRRIPDLAKAKEILGYEPKVSMRDAISLTIKKIREEKK